MIKFRCSGCQKAIGVDEKYAGRLIKCPSCQNATRVPVAATSVEVPTAQAAEAPTMAHVPKAAVNPVCPSCQSELFNPSDTMCGICGRVLEQAPLPQRNADSIPRVGTPVEATPVGLPMNPALASSYENPSFEKSNAYSPSVGDTGNPGPTTGRSVGAWFAAVGVGMFLALIWGVVASFFGVGAQVFAWAIGAIVGCLAGLIARDPSIKFCLATTLGSLICMLFGRLVSAVVIMAAVSTMNSVQQLSFLLPDTGVSIGVMEDMNSNGELVGVEKEIAESKIDAFFANKSIYDMPEYDDVESESELELDRKVREAVREMSSDEKESMLENVRAAHPEWMEHSWHSEAILDSMVEAEEIDDEGLLEHAVSKLLELDGDTDEGYYKDTSQSERLDREGKLRELVMDRYASMDQKERDEAIRNARLNHLGWSPKRHEYLAMLDAMSESGDIPKELKAIAKSSINLELDRNYDDAFESYDEDFDFEKRQKQETELKKLVNEELLKLDQDEVDKLVASTKEKYPNWTPEIEMAVFDDIAEGLDDMITRFDSDGTFWSSLKTRFRMLDFVWLGLGMISAFAIAFTLGQSGKKS